MQTIVKDEYGIVIDGKFHKLDWMHQLVDLLSTKVISKVEERLGMTLSGERNYKVRQVATMTQRSVATITLHCRIGLLKASKVGKSWLITEENYINYKNNIYNFD